MWIRCSGCVAPSLCLLLLMSLTSPWHEEAISPPSRFHLCSYSRNQPIFLQLKDYFWVNTPSAYELPFGTKGSGTYWLRNRGSPCLTSSNLSPPMAWWTCLGPGEGRQAWAQVVLNGPTSAFFRESSGAGSGHYQPFHSREHPKVRSRLPAPFPSALPLFLHSAMPRPPGSLPVSAPQGFCLLFC